MSRISFFLLLNATLKSYTKTKQHGSSLEAHPTIPFSPTPAYAQTDAKRNGPAFAADVEVMRIVVWHRIYLYQIRATLQLAYRTAGDMASMIREHAFDAATSPLNDAAEWRRPQILRTTTARRVD